MSGSVRAMDISKPFVVRLAQDKGFQLPGRVPAVQIRNLDKSFFHLVPRTPRLEKMLEGRPNAYFRARMAGGFLIFLNEVDDFGVFGPGPFGKHQASNEEFEGFASDQSHLQEIFN